jgi:hypothetical protein
MKTIQDGNERLEVTNSNLFLPGWFVLFGGFAFCQQLWTAYRGQLHLADIKSDGPILFGAVFFLIGLALCRRYSVSFDRLQQQMTWKRMGAFGTTSRTVPFGEINSADFEIDPNNFTQSHSKWGPPLRLVVSTREASLPLSGMYGYGDAATERARTAINAFLGRPQQENSADAVDRHARALLQRGQLQEAITFVRARRGCSLLEAKDIIDRLNR